MIVKALSLEINCIVGEDARNVMAMISEMSRRPLVKRCYNHSPRQCQQVIDARAKENEAPSTLLQDYHNFNDGDDDSACSSSSSSEEESPQNEQLKPGEAFAMINPSLKALLSLFESRNASRTDVKELKRNIVELQGKFTERFRKKHQTNPPSSHFVSSSLSDHSRKKTHGTKHLR
jgi:hypothetical protein